FRFPPILRSRASQFHRASQLAIGIAREKSCPYVLCPSCNDGMGKTSIASSESEEQLSTKLRTLLQPRKNRDLFDLNERLKQLAMNRDKLTACFDDYLKLEGNRITRATAERRMQEKRT